MTTTSLTPTRKVGAGGLAAGLSIILVWILGLAGVTVPAEVASSITTVLGFAVAWLVPEG